MTDLDTFVLQRYLQAGRAALLWKLEGLSERQARMPMTPSGTNVLGVVKHVASVELGYLGEVFGRPSGIELPWFADDAEDNADMWATPEESRESIVELYRAAARHGDATIEALDLDAEGEVPWWPAERRSVTLHQILVHLIAETHRHAGQVDIVRELLDGSLGLAQGKENLPDGDASWWATYRQRLQDVANSFPDETSP